MAATVTALGSLPGSAVPPGYKRTGHFLVTFDASSPAGGYAITPAMFGLVNLDGVITEGITILGRSVAYIATTKKIQLFVPAVGAAAAADMTAATDLHLDAVQCTVIGS